jgi:hypothetical protein
MDRPDDAKPDPRDDPRVHQSEDRRCLMAVTTETKQLEAYPIPSTGRMRWMIYLLVAAVLFGGGVVAWNQTDTATTAGRAGTAGITLSDVHVREAPAVQMPAAGITQTEAQVREATAVQRPAAGITQTDVQVREAPAIQQRASRITFSDVQVREGNGRPAP